MTFCFCVLFKECPLPTVAIEPGRQIALSRNLKKFQLYVFFFEFLPPPSWSSIWLGTNYEGGSLDLSQYLGGELFLNLHLNFPRSPTFIFNSFARPIGLLSCRLPLRSFLLTRSKRQRLFQSNLGQNLRTAITNV